MERFAGRVAVVTGASSGIGAAVAQELVRAGLIVVGVARRRNRLTTRKARGVPYCRRLHAVLHAVQALAQALEAEGAAGRLQGVHADLSRVDEVRRVYQWVEDNLGGVSVAINNAGILVQQPIQEMDAVDMQRIVNTNLTAVMACCKEAVASMKRHDIRDGHIVNINSVAGHVFVNQQVPDPMSISAYTATKFAITALCKGLRFDVHKLEGFKIRVTSISPGAVVTEIVPKEVLEHVPEPDMILKARDVAASIIYVLSCPPSVEITELQIQPIGEVY